MEPRDIESAVGLIWHQARSNPTSVAVSKQGQSLTYAELERASEGVATLLSENGTRAGDIVPLLTSRCLEMVVCLLAISRTGAVWVPMEIDTWGADRIKAVSERLDYNVALVTDHGSRGLRNAICLGEIQAVMEASLQPREAETTRTAETKIDMVKTSRLKDVAYIIFTSGTTGVPKGIEIKHESLLNYVWPNHENSSMPFNLGVQPGDVVLLLFSVAFDAYYGVLFSTLCNGGHLLLSEPLTFVDDARLCNILPATPTLLGAIDPSDSTHLRAIFLGGEAPSPELIRKWSCPGRRIYNAYGPTESTISVTMAELRPDHPITLGSTIRNSQVFLLDEGMNESSVGEICISGPTVLALGYYKDPERTQSSFVLWKGERIYKTGDMAKLAEEGLVFLGRKDFIVKNRGFLINIEAEVVPALLAYPGIVSATAAMHRQRLTAFVSPIVVEDGLEIRKFLESKQDRFLIPDEIIVMEQLPQTGNGKIDTKALIQDLGHRDAGGRDREKGMESSEGSCDAMSVFRRVLADALKISATSMNMERSFTQLGGNSVFAIKAVRLLKQHGFNVSLASLFQEPNLFAIFSQVATEESSRANGLITSEDDGTFVEATKVTTNGDYSEQSTESFPLTSTQQGIVRSTMLEPPTGYMMLRISVADIQTNRDVFPLMMSQAWSSILSSIDLFSCQFNLFEDEGKLGCEYHHHWETIAVDVNGLEEAVSWQSDQLLTLTGHAQPSQSGIFKPVTAFRFVYQNDETSKTANGVLLWLVHHALVDGESISAIFESVLEELASLSQSGQENRPRNRSASFFKYANAVDLHINSARDEASTFWASVLEPVLSGTQINIIKSNNRPGDAADGSAHQKQLTFSSIIEEEMLDIGIPIADFKTCAQAIDGTSAAVIFHAAWALFLQRYSGNDTVVFGSAISARNLPIAGVEDIIGPLLNHCPVPVNVPERSITRRAFLQSIRDLLMQIVEYQWTFPQVLEKLSAGSHARIFSTALFLEYDLPGVASRDARPGAGEAWSWERTDWPEFGLTMQVRNQEGQLSLRALFKQEQYPRNLVRGMIQHFRNLALALVSPGEKTLRDVQQMMLGDAEMLCLVRNNPAYFDPYYGPQSLKELFEIGVDKWPEGIAIESQLKSLSYRDLDSITNFIGRQITEFVGARGVIAVLGDGSIDWLVGAISVLKAGGTYLPLDTKLPVERMAIMMETAGAHLVILPNKQCLQQYPTLEGRELFMDEMWEYEQGASSALHERLPTTATMDDYAYIMFTSGTTGTPKGIKVTHRATLSHFASEVTTLNAHPGRRHAQIFSAGFDVSIAETFGVLCRGATLVLKDPSDPFAHLARVHATMITPSLLSVLSVSDYPLLDSIYLIGEAVPQALVDAWSEHKTVWNFYGPCECTIAALYTQLKAGNRVTIGKPLPRVGVYILDQDTLPVPVGVIGEIYLSGVQVMQGYIGQGSEAATKRAFMQDPFLEGQPLYKTGDLGFWNEDMNVVFLGRTDHQVKVRGYRVELDEVEHIIRKSSESVQQASVIVLQDRIVAFVSPEVVDVTSMQAALQQSLPSYAVPQNFFTLKSLPMTPNQKLDRKALSLMATKLQKIHPPASTQEKGTGAEVGGKMLTLVESVWRSVLSLGNETHIGADDDFMVIGGHSLQQIKVAQKVCAVLGQTIPFGIFIRNTRLESLAQAIEDFSQQLIKSVGNGFLHYCGLDTKTSPESVSHAELEMLRMHRGSACPSTLNVAHMITISGHIQVHLLKQAMELIAAGHDILRTRYILKGDGTAWCTVVDPAFLVDVLEEPLTASAVDAIVNTPFDLQNDQLSRITIMREASDCTKIIFVQHHLICDQKSLQIFFRQVAEAYHDLQTESGPLVRSAKANYYRSWAAWTAQQLWKPLDESRKKFWLSAFNGISPHDTCRIANIDSASLRTPIHAQSGALKRPSYTCGLHSYLSLVARACAKVFGLREILLAVPFIDRSEPGTDEILGLFLDAIPIRVSTALDDDATLEVQVHTSLQDVLENYVPLHLIREAVNMQRLFDIMVVYNRFEERVTRDMDIPGVQITTEPIRAQGSKFPMLIEFTEGEDDGLVIEFEYFSEAVSTPHAEELMSSLKSLVSGCQ